MKLRLHFPSAETQQVQKFIQLIYSLIIHIQK